MDSVAKRIAGFHLAAEQATRDARELARLLEPFEETWRRSARSGPRAGTRPPPRCGALQRPFLAARRDQSPAGRCGLVRDCHGDLRAEHVTVDDAVGMYDCIEFNPSLRLIDVGQTSPFVMDLVHLGQEALASRLVSSYREVYGDPGDDALLHFYAAYRAWVRAKVACLRAEELPEGGPGATTSATRPGRCWRLGTVLLGAPACPGDVVCGVAASGKTVLASRLADVWAFHT